MKNKGILTISEYKSLRPIYYEELKKDYCKRNNLSSVTDEEILEQYKNCTFLKLEYEEGAAI